jgi:very-short-patch-repair endonuclease
VLEQRTGGASKTESDYERMMLGLLRRARLPMPETQQYVLGFKVDMFWRDLNLIVEVDAYGTHGSRAKFESDRRRDAKLQLAGYIVIRITGREIEHEPHAAVARVSQAIGAATATKPANAPATSAQ